MRNIKYVSLLLIFLSFCQKDISFKERDEILKIAFENVQSSNEEVVISGLKLIRKYPTHKGLKILLDLWKKDLSEKSEEEVLLSLKSDEVFMNSDSLIKEIFKKQYAHNVSLQKKYKLKRLLKCTDAVIKYKLLKIIDSGIKE